jgi:translation elongation factor P/translation initiation factor 5A
MNRDGSSLWLSGLMPGMKVRVMGPCRWGVKDTQHPVRVTEVVEVKKGKGGGHIVRVEFEDLVFSNDRSVLKDGHRYKIKSTHDKDFQTLRIPSELAQKLKSADVESLVVELIKEAI